MTERRLARRQETVDLLDYFILGDDGEKVEYSMGRTLNISEGGILLETPKSLQLGQMIIITLDLGDSLIEIKGIVAHAVISAGRYQAGVKFADLDKESTEIIQEYVEAFDRRNPKGIEKASL